MTTNMRSFVCPHSGIRLSKYLYTEIYGLSRIYFSELLKKKDIKINGKRISSDVTLELGDSVTVYADESRLKQAEIKVIADYPDILILYKQKGVSTECFEREVKRALGENLSAAHRLDTNTDGLIIFSKSEKAFNLLKTAFKNGDITKKYRALVYGELKNGGVHTAFLKKNADKGLVTVSKNEADGARILTGITPLGYSDGKTTVEVDLLTGKTHQIRAHLAFLGFPIVGDGKYGNFEADRKSGINVQQLTAVSIAFKFDAKNPLSYLDGKSFAFRALDADE